MNDGHYAANYHEADAATTERGSIVALNEMGWAGAGIDYAAALTGAKDEAAGGI
jgi:hypothetical protein